ncbi:sushi, von Willebrand factor type A, EGF and pentraxin domain-containing protein 1-like [Haliotis asinina]|uniref:sushi, von Willebrand factor type A, EGF and pentraxin domain-containing protein 1-like n=1 Tax=Haliotis asinina TaxID=109174 RepID=UPI00353225E0
MSIWSGKFGCEVANCTSAPTALNGKLDCPAYIPIGASCNLTCNYGFRPRYSDKLNCQHGGIWSSDASCVEVKCPAPPPVNNGFLRCGSSILHNYKLDDTCHVTCNPGYKLNSSSEIKCLDDDTWSTANCVAVNCTTTPTALNGKLDCPAYIPIGASCNLTCNYGFRPRYSHKLNCQSGGIWSSDASCVEQVCPPPPAVSNGRYNCTGATMNIDTVCGLQCDSGYKPSTGVTAMTCLDGETWTAPGSCIEKKCHVPQHVDNGHLNCSTPSVKTGTSCNLTCESGFGPSFGVRERLCRSDETWSESVTCVDTSPPVFINCPSSQSHILKPNQTSINITWPEVKAIDSPNGDFLNVTLTSFLQPGSGYPAGNYTIHYETMDKSGNKAHPCSFTVSIWTCPPGSYLDVSKDKCVPCPTGTYQEYKGHVACVPCLIGFTTSSEGSDSSSKCKGCPKGSYLDVPKMKCVLCPTGTYQEHEGSLQCVSCLHGFTTVSEGSNSSSSCSGPCGPGSFSSDGLEPCSLCPIGTYQTQSGSKQCDSCPGGKGTKMPGGKRLGDCICPRGYYLMDVLLLTKCVACPKGTYQDQEDSNKCVYCPWGLSTSTDGSGSKTDCKAPCQPGTSSSDGLQPCTPCPRGSYQSSTGQTNCDLCPKGHTTNATGALGSTDCTASGV